MIKRMAVIYIFVIKRPETYEWAFGLHYYQILSLSNEFDNGVNRKLIHMFLAFLLQKYTSLPCVWSFSLPYIYT